MVLRSTLDIAGHLLKALEIADIKKKVEFVERIILEEKPDDFYYDAYIFGSKKN